LTWNGLWHTLSRIKEKPDGREEAPGELPSGLPGGFQERCGLERNAGEGRKTGQKLDGGGKSMYF